ncbi:MAG: sulfite exporter TauE/SafE family protein [bacterium]|nr:sulfite exporter TauE/SafE family protein [bacterium]
MKDIIFLIVLFGANVIQAITGFAGTVLAMPPSMYLLGMDNAKVVLNAMAWISGLLIASSGFQKIRWKELMKMVVFMLFGMAAGIAICSVVSSNSLLLTIYGVIIILVALKNIFVKKTHELPAWILILILLLAGIVHGMFVSGGALLVIYAVQVLKDKEEFRATVAPVWVVLNTFLMVSQYRQGLYTAQNIRLILVSILPLLVATWLGTKIAKKVPQKVFLYITYVLLLISGCTLVL